MQPIIEFIFQSFWRWLGAIMIMIIPFNFVVRVIHEISEWSNTRKHGWKPRPELPKLKKEPESKK